MATKNTSRKKTTRKKTTKTTPRPLRASSAKPEQPAVDLSTLEADSPIVAEVSKQVASKLIEMIWYQPDVMHRFAVEMAKVMANDNQMAAQHGAAISEQVIRHHGCQAALAKECVAHLRDNIAVDEIKSAIKVRIQDIATAEYSDCVAEHVRSDSVQKILEQRIVDEAVRLLRPLILSEEAIEHYLGESSELIVSRWLENNAKDINATLSAFGRLIRSIRIVDDSQRYGVE